MNASAASRPLSLRLLRCVLALSTFGVLSLSAATETGRDDAPEYPRMGPDIFDTRVDGADLISSALSDSRASGKRVLLFVSANWCPWTRRLHAILHETPALRRGLGEHYILVYLDANTRRDQRRNASVLERLGNPQKRLGIPVFVLLDREGNVVSTQETQSFAAPTDSEVAVRLSRFLRMSEL